MSARDMILGIIEACGGVLQGRTYLQKLAYFVSKAFGLRTGYAPHFYGPYSRLVSAEADSAVEGGMLTEHREDFGSALRADPLERVRYTYQLQPAGRRYLKAVKALDEEGFAQLEQTVRSIRETGANYRQLSCAAKIDYLLTAAGGRITRARAKHEGKRLGWRLTDSDIQTAVDILDKLGIAKSR